MNGIANAMAIVLTIARSIVPLVGILVFQWSAANVLILYLLDTLLAIAMIVAGIASSFAPTPGGEGVGGWINAVAGQLMAGLLVAAFMAIPLSIPVGIMLGSSDFSFGGALHDASLRNGAIIQIVLALWSYVGLYRALRTHSPAELRLRQRFALVFMRWVVVIMVTYVIIEFLPPGEFVLLLLVAAYIGASIFAEIAPDRFLRSMPGGESNLAPDATDLSTSANKHAARKASRDNT